MNTQHFNAYDVILLVTFLQATTFSVLLLLRPEKNASYYLLPAFMASVALGQLGFFFMYNPMGSGFMQHTVGIHQFDFFCLPFFLQGPLLFHYLRALTETDYKLRWQDYTPLAIFLFLYLLNPVARFGGFLEFLFWRNYVFMGVAGFIVSCFYGIRCIYYMHRYSSKLKDRFCSVESVDFIWLIIFAWGFCAIWFLELLPPFFYNRAPWIVTQIATHSKNFIEMGMVMFVIFATLMQARKVVSIETPEEDAKLQQLAEAGDNQISKEEIDSIAQKLQDDKLYLQAGLTVEQLANHVEMPVKTLSLIINRYYEKNFFDFVNHYRVEEARRLLKSPEHAKDSIQQIYEAVGFRSKSSFNTLFKKTVGVTPSKYREKYGKKPAA